MNCSFADLGLADALVRAVADEGYTTPTPIQAQAIPPVLAGRDVLAGAQTGTGKTAAFVLPMLQRLLAHANTSASPARRPIRGLIVTPTRELAAQIQQSVHTYGKYVALRSTVVFGGVGIGPQTTTLRRGVDILVATPGRLLDHVQQRSVDVSKVEILVLDEADRMLDMGFIHDIRRIISLLPSKRQSLLFSATFSGEIRKLAAGLLRSPLTIEVARSTVDAELVTQRVHLVEQDRKRQALAHLIRSESLSQVLVFSRTKHGANRLAEQLSRDGVSATAIHGNKTQSQRMKALAEFKQANVRVLVATDIAARGLDIDALPHVVNFDLPNVAENYVHRIGRTGRAGNAGEAISLVSREDRPLLLAIEQLLKRRLARLPLTGFSNIASEPGKVTTPRKSHEKGVRWVSHRNPEQSRSGQMSKPSGSSRANQGPPQCSATKTGGSRKSATRIPRILSADDFGVETIDHGDY